MDIRLDKNHKIISDPLNIMIQERKIGEKGKNKGKEYWWTTGYYSTVQGALISYLRKNINEPDATSIHQLIDRVDEVEEVIKKIKY